jgi:hypothetical protein
LQRAKELAHKKQVLFATPALSDFLYHHYAKKDFIENENLLNVFAQLDDYDIMASIKVWANHSDKVLASLCKKLVNRELFKVTLQSQPFKRDKIKALKNKMQKQLNVNAQEIKYFVFNGIVTNDAYRADKIRINILFKDGTVTDIAEASDQLNIDVLAKTVKKYYLCFPEIN